MRRSHSYQLALTWLRTRSAGQLGSEVKLFSYTTKSEVEVPPDEPPVRGGIEEPVPGEGGVVPVAEALGVTDRPVPVVLMAAAAGSDILVIGGGNDDKRVMSRQPR